MVVEEEDLKLRKRKTSELEKSWKRKSKVEIERYMEWKTVNEKQDMKMMEDTESRAR